MFLSLFFTAALSLAPLHPEARTFLDKLPPDVQTALTTAIEEAASGNHDALNRIRAARPATPPPAGVSKTAVSFGGLKADLYTSDKPHSTLLIYLHGGGWVIGNLNTASRISGDLAKIAPVDTLALDYRLAPEHPYPAQHDDLISVLSALKDHPRTRHYANVVLAGDSAGAHIAITVTRAWLDNKPVQGPAIQSIVAIYPVTSFKTDWPSYALYGKGFGMDTPLMKAFLQAAFPKPLTPAQRQAWEPLEIDPTGFPEVYLFTSGYDVLRDQGWQWAQKLRQAKVPLYHHHTPDAMHLYITVPGMPTHYSQTLRRIQQRLRR